MAKDDSLTDTFATLRGILDRQGNKLKVIVDKPGDFQVASPTRTDRIGRPLFAAAVQIKRSYVSFHLMPIYAVPELQRGMSTELRKRMQGKACFNFTTIEASHVRELAALTKKGIAKYERIALPWTEGR